MPVRAGTDPDAGLAEIVQAGAPILTDGGIETRFLFTAGIRLDPELGAATMVGDPVGKPALRAVYDGHVAAAAGEGIPMIIGTPTFRASRRYIERAGLSGQDAVLALNAGAVAFLMDVRATSTERVWIAGVLGPAGDAYRPAEALDAPVGRAYHAEQATALAGAGVDLLFAPTFPSVEEAVGVSEAMAATGRPYVVSFVLGGDGRVLDGTPLPDAIARGDDASAPLFYSLSCIHTSVPPGRSAASPQDGCWRSRRTPPISRRTSRWPSTAGGRRSDALRRPDGGAAGAVRGGCVGWVLRHRRPPHARSWDRLLEEAASGGKETFSMFRPTSTQARLSLTVCLRVTSRRINRE